MRSDWISINWWNCGFKRNYKAKMVFGSKEAWCFDVFRRWRNWLLGSLIQCTGAQYTDWPNTNRYTVIYTYSVYTTNRQNSGTRKHVRDAKGGTSVFQNCTNMRYISYHSQNSNTPFKGYVISVQIHQCPKRYPWKLSKMTLLYSHLFLCKLGKMLGTLPHSLMSLSWPWSCRDCSDPRDPKILLNRYWDVPQS